MEDKSKAIEILKTLVDKSAEELLDNVLADEEYCVEDYAAGNIDDAASHGERLAYGHVSKRIREALALLGGEA